MTWQRCRYCAAPIGDDDDLECPDCRDYEPRYVDPDELKHYVARWAVVVEGQDMLYGKKVDDVDTGEYL